MDGLFLSNLSAPPLLFFFLGALAAFARSDLELPAQITKFLSLYLLMAIGFKGGLALQESGAQAAVWRDLGIAFALACAVPLLAFAIARRFASLADAAAIAATYGSISAVTFVTGTSYLDAAGVAWSGHLVAAMALMESPAIVLGIVLYQMNSAREARANNGSTAAAKAGIDWGAVGREACLNGSVVLIVGAMLIGTVASEGAAAQLKPFTEGLFVGMLCLFLLDMGIVAARRIRDVRRSRRETGTKPAALVAFALLMPLFNAVVGASIAVWVGMGEGDALLLTLLAASASYIAVPAAMRLALPEANPSIYLSMSLAVTFPLNILVGIPMYHLMVRALLGV